MVSVDIELALVGLVAMLEPATLISSALALTLGDRPLRTGSWFYLGGFGTTMLIGVIAAFALGDAAFSPTSTPKTWVAIVNVVAGVLLGAYVAYLAVHPADPEKTAANVARMRRLTAASAPTIIVAGVALANAGVFMIVALKAISQLDPSTLQYVLDWTLFALASMLPLGIGLLMLLMAPMWTGSHVAGVRAWIERHARTIAVVVMAALAISLLRDGITGLAN